MSRIATAALTVLIVTLATAAAAPREDRREIAASSGGTLTLDLEAGASVEIVGHDAATVAIDSRVSCKPDCTLEVEEVGDGVRVRTRFAGGGRKQSSNIDLAIRVPRVYDVEIDSTGGGVSIEGVEGTFEGRTMGGGLDLRDVRGTAVLKTMGGAIVLLDSELDGKLETMGGAVRFENVVGDVRGSSMGGDVRFVNVVRRGGGIGAPDRTGEGLDEMSPETALISTMGGDIRVDDAPEGADVHTMGGDIEIGDARRFVRAKTMGGDIEIDAVDGWVKAVTMGGDVEVGVVGAGGEVEIESMSGDVVLTVPAGFGMDLDVELAFTKNARREFRLDVPGDLPQSVTPEWDTSRGTPRKVRSVEGAVNGGGHRVSIRTVNGDVVVRER